MLDESVGTTDVTKTSETDLGNNSSELARRGRNTVCSRTVTSGEDLTRNDEGGGVGAKVLEEVGQAVEEDESLSATGRFDELVVCETHDDESGSEHGETHKLDRLASPRVDEKEGDPVSGDETSDSEDQVSDGDVVQVPVDLERSVDVCWGSETDGGQDDGGVESEAVESDLNGGLTAKSDKLRENAYVESEPRPGSTQQNLSILPLTEVPAEVGPACLGYIDLGGDNGVIGTGLDTFQVTLDIPDSLVHVTLDIEGETRGFGDSETEVKGDNTGDASEADEETPTVVNVVGCRGGIRKDGALVGVNDDEGDESGSWKDFRSMPWR